MHTYTSRDAVLSGLQLAAYNSSYVTSTCRTCYLERKREKSTHSNKKKCGTHQGWSFCMAIIQPLYLYNMENMLSLYVCGLVGGVWMVNGCLWIFAFCTLWGRESCECKILIFHMQQKLKSVTLKCQPSAASQVYLRDERGVVGVRGRGREKREP